MHKIKGNDSKKNISYDYLLATQFHTMPKISLDILEETVLEKVYPVQYTDLWSACLDVISQSTVILYVSESKGKIIFFHQIALPVKIQKDNIQPVDIMLALYIQPRGAQGSTIKVAFLSDPGLTVSPIPDLQQDDIDSLSARLEGSRRRLPQQ